MGAFELTLNPVRPDRNYKTGRFLKGRKTHNKGKKWDEYMSVEGQQRAKRGWINLSIYAESAKRMRSPLSGKKPAPVIGIENGRPMYFPSIEAAARWINGLPQSIHRCMHDNRAKTINKRNGKINTDHKYKGVRFYYENDDSWMQKIIRI